MVIAVLLTMLTIPEIEHDTTSQEYRQQQFDYYREIFNRNIDFDDSIASEAIQMALYYGQFLDIDSFKRAAILMNVAVTTKQGLPEKIRYCAQAWKWCPKNHQVLKNKLAGNLGFYYYRQLKIDSALIYYRLAIKGCLTNNSPCITIRNNISLMYSDLGDRQNALDVLVPVATYLEDTYPDGKLDPGSEDEYTTIPLILENMVTNTLETNDLIASEHYLRFLNKITSQNKFEWYYAMAANAATAKYLSTTGDIERAMYILDEMKEITFRHLPIDDNEIAQSYIIQYAQHVVNHHQMERYDDALKALRVIQRPAYRRQGSYYRLLGMLHLASGRADSATVYLEKSDQIQRVVAREVNIGSSVISERNQLDQFTQKTIIATPAVNWHTGPIMFALGAVTAMGLVSILMVVIKKRRGNQYE